MDKKSLNRNLILSQLVFLGVLGILLWAEIPIYVLFPIMIIVSASVLTIISRRLQKQYNLISRAAQQIAKGDHSMRIPDLELDEINNMGQDLNEMLGKLDNTIHHLAVHREELRLVLGTIEDVLWSQNPEGRLVWANQAFADLFPSYNPESLQYYWEVIREPMLLSEIKESVASPKKLMKEVLLGDTSYLLSATENPQARRKVFILQNITIIRTAEQMKKDFVANLAHELRTPLTAIKGFTDAMQDKPLANNHRYLQIIQNHTSRLIHLISDLEQLIRLERTAELELKEINLGTFFHNVQLILNPHVEEKGLKLLIELDDTLPRIHCDPFKLEQVFINLVQNSLRYTEHGTISIHSYANDMGVMFEVRDTGKGIEAQHLPRIFERFYVADPSRNKSQSGTGLGLAIVKHIVLLHHGRIEVESHPGIGSTFKIFLPIQ